MENTTPLRRVEVLESAIEDARSTREHYRRRTRPGDELRQHKLEERISVLNIALSLVRSDLGRLQWNPVLDRQLGDRMREASRQGQLERRKLRKMLR